MATAASTQPDPDTDYREQLVFVVIAVVIAATVVAGFGSFILLDLSSFVAPWWVHVHAVSFMAWIALYVVQNFYILQGDPDAHRRLGRVGFWLAPWLVLVALLLTPVAVTTQRMPPFFDAAFFLALDWVNILCFAGLVYAALRMRRQTEWHRRLMLCATVVVIMPAWGRLLVLADVMTQWTNVAVLLLYVAVAMVADLRIRGRVHPAYYWGVGAIFAMAPMITLVANMAPIEALAARLTS